MHTDVHDPAFWEEQWRVSERGDTETISKGYSTAAFWDNMAAGYDRRFNQAAQEKLDTLADRLEREGFLRDGAEVLDIGCGTGRLAITLAGRGARVTGTDISSGMLAKLDENCPADLRTSITTERIDWHSLDLARKGWEGAFDLVIANMTPALNTPEALDRMIRASRHGCYLKAWAEKHAAPVIRTIWRAIAGRELTDRHAPFIYMLNLLLARGYFPAVYFDEMRLTRTTPADEVIANNITYFTGVFGSSNHLIPDIVTEEVNRLAVDGAVTETIGSMTGTLMWTV